MIFNPRWQQEQESDSVAEDYLRLVSAFGFSEEDIERVVRRLGRYPSMLEMALASSWKAIKILAG